MSQASKILFKVQKIGWTIDADDNILFVETTIWLENLYLAEKPFIIFSWIFRASK